MVVDPIPRQVPEVPRRVPLVLVVALLLGFVVGAAIALIRDSVRAPSVGKGLSERERFALALAHLPVVGRK
jgi:hypothetical protein